MKLAEDPLPIAHALVERILETIKDHPAEEAADALAIAFAEHVKRSFNVPRLGCDYAFVDTTLEDKELGTMAIRVVMSRQIPEVDRQRKFVEPEGPPDAGG